MPFRIPKKRKAEAEAPSEPAPVPPPPQPGKLPDAAAIAAAAAAAAAAIGLKLPSPQPQLVPRPPSGPPPPPQPPSGFPPPMLQPPPPGGPALQPPPPPQPPPPRTKNLSLPDGWVHCAPGGAAICNLAPVKTPLSAEYFENREIARWTPDDCVAACGGAQKVGLVVDLTNSSRYYQPSEVPPPTRHLKLAVGGHALPPPQLVERFLHELQSLPADTVAVVHCTHGINRTGFLIAIALVRLHGYSLCDALDAFAKIRPPGVWREEYIKALHDSFGGPPPPVPEKPEWEHRTETLTSRWGGGAPPPPTAPPPQAPDMSWPRK